jgi:hypothetical protein
MTFNDPKLNTKLRRAAYCWNKAIKDINTAIQAHNATLTPKGKHMEALPVVYGCDTH